jgi:hypothetical protein
MVGHLESELALSMFAIYLTIPFIFVALAIAAVPFWRSPTARRAANAHVSTSTQRARGPHDRVAA